MFLKFVFFKKTQIQKIIRGSRSIAAAHARRPRHSRQKNDLVITDQNLCDRPDPVPARPPLASMSVLTIQLGQCGNQVGGEFFENMAAAGAGAAGGDSGGAAYSSPFFRPAETAAADGERGAVARAVMVDMEPKVIQVLLLALLLHRESALLHRTGASCGSRRRDCHFTDTPRLSLLNTY